MIANDRIYNDKERDYAYEFTIAINHSSLDYRELKFLFFYFFIHF